MSSSSMLLEVESSAETSHGLSWWRGGKRQRSGYSSSSASTIAFEVLWSCSSRAPLGGTQSVFY
jgi:hypothetical protein